MRSVVSIRCSIMALCLCAVPAFGQQSTTSTTNANCYINGQEFDCTARTTTTSQPDLQASFRESYENGQRIGSAIADVIAARRLRIEERNGEKTELRGQERADEQQSMEAAQQYKKDLVAQTNERRSEVDAFFNNPNLLKFSGCDPSTWEAIRQALLADLQIQKLSESPADADEALAQQTTRCVQTASSKRNQMYGNLKNNSDKDASITLLEEYSTLNIMAGFAQEASDSYINHAEDTRLRNLAAHYNALVDSFNARVHGSQRTAHLNCTTSTGSSGMTATECQ
jgi:hypothetical protein